MHELGFELDDHTFEELFEEVDSRGEGTVTRDELITALGMLKQNILEVMELEKAFTRLREKRLRMESQADSAGSGRKSSSHPDQRAGPNKSPSPVGERKKSCGGSPLSLLGRAPSNEAAAAAPAGKEEKDGHMVYASDLVLTLGVSEAEAEEMIFIADLQDNQAIDFTEFKQVVVNWS